ncbi:MAG: efflux RND transporter periplasmic adaptor subunit [Pseudomonadota bacterium]
MTDLRIMIVGAALAAALAIVPTAAANAAEPAATAAPVRAQMPMIAERVRGVVRAVEEAVISAPVQKRLKVVPARVGQRFTVGQTLIEFDCAEEVAARRAAEASHRAKQLILKNKRRLRALRAAGAHDVSLARAETDRARAEIDVIAARVSACLITAPFDGRVSGLFVKAHETPAPHAKLISIVSLRRLDLKIIVPSRWVRWIKRGYRFAFHVDDTGRAYNAEVVSVSGRVDPISQTIEVIADVTNVDALLLPGMSGEAVFRHRAG